MSTKPSETTAAIDPQQDWSAYVADFRRAAHDAVDWVAEYLADPRRYPVTPKTKPGELVDALPSSDPIRASPSRPSSATSIRRSFLRSRIGITPAFSPTSDAPARRRHHR